MKKELQDELNIIISDLENDDEIDEEDEDDEIWMDDDDTENRMRKLKREYADDLTDYEFEMLKLTLKDFVDKFDREIESPEDVEIEIDNAEDEEEVPNHWIDELGNRPILQGVNTLWSENLNPVQVTDREREQIRTAAGLKTGRDKNESPARLIIENLV
jgi:hypothetical protein